MVKAKDLLILLGIQILIFGAGFLVGHKSHRNSQNSEVKPKPDTLIIRDTIVSEKATKTQIPTGFELVAAKTLDSLRNNVTEVPVIVTERDTMYIAVPMSRYTFSDNKTYKVELSGYNVQMLRHESFQETKIVTQYVATPPKWAISGDLRAFCVKDEISLGIGVKASLWQNKWQFSPFVGYAVYHSSGGYGHAPYFGFSIDYNFLMK